MIRKVMRVAIAAVIAALSAAPAAYGGEPETDGATAQSAQGGYLTGSVSLAGSGTIMSSNGSAEYIITSCQPGCPSRLVGQHSLSDSASNAVIAQSEFDVEGDLRYSGLVTASGASGRCYRGRLSASAVMFGGGVAASNSWGTAQVCAPPPPPRPPDDEGEGGSEDEDGCPTSGGLCYDPSTPIILDVSGDGYNLTGLDDTVSFDLDADGKPELLTWTAANSDDAFLAYDRNGNGRIDNGAELFGAVTPLSTGEKASIGYIALADADLKENGGNFDKFIGPEDKIFAGLLLWTDRNHDGLSDVSELQAAEEIGILRFEYDYIVMSNKRDRNGNRFLYKGQAWARSRAIRGRSYKHEYEPAPPGNHTGFQFPIYDVILQRADKR